MRILFVFPALPLVENHSGAASRYRQNFVALTELGHEIHVVAIRSDKAITFAETYDSGTNQLATSWHNIVSKPHKRRNHLHLYFDLLFCPLNYVFLHVLDIAEAVNEYVQSIQPDLIWAEGTEIAAALSLLCVSVPWVFSHHDFQYRIQQIRYGNKSLKQRIINYAYQRAEIKVLRRTKYVLTGSSTEAQRVQKFGPATYVTPISYSNHPLELNQLTGRPRILHLGSLETTANRSGLEAYLRRIHPKLLQQKCPLELWIIGDATLVKEPLKSLLDQPNVVLKGYIGDLANVLRPYDISILPYEHDTGYRTKLPLLLSYAQVIISTKTAVAGTRIEGLEEASILLDSIDEFAEAINKLADDSYERERLGRSARNFFERHFTHETVVKQYASIIQQVTAHSI